MTAIIQRVIHHSRILPHSSAMHFQREKPRVETEGFTSYNEVFQALRIIEEQLVYDLSFENLLSTPVPVTAYKNQEQGVNWDQTKFYRTPQYLLLTNKSQARLLTGNLLNCACLKFYADDGYLDYGEDDIFQAPFLKLKTLIEKHKTDIVIFPFNEDYVKAEKFMREHFPDIGFLVYCNDSDESMNKKKYALIAKQIREKRYYAITKNEILNHQEYVSHITAHALGKKGIENLRKVISV